MSDLTALLAAGDESLSAPIVIDGIKNQGSGYSCDRYTGPAVTPCTGSNMPTGCPSVVINKPIPIPPPMTQPAARGFPGSCPLPRDRTFTTNVGNGATTADLQAYWNNHHSGSLPSIPANTAPRYYIYQQEASGAAPFTAASDAAEPHAPACTNSTIGNVSRRVVNVAVVDCNYWSIKGHSNPIPAASLVAQFFMTEPADSNGGIHGEFIGCFSTNSANTSSGCGTSNTTGLTNPLHSLVQLVR